MGTSVHLGVSSGRPSSLQRWGIADLDRDGHEDRDDDEGSQDSVGHLPHADGVDPPAVDHQQVPEFGLLETLLMHFKARSG